MSLKEMNRNNVYYVRNNLRAFEVSGDDADEALNYFLTKENEFSDENTVSYQLALDNNGNVLAEVIVYKLENKYLLFSSQNLFELFDSSYDDLSIKEDGSLKLIQIEGKKSPGILEQLYDYDISTLEFRSVDDANFNDNDIILARFGFTGEFGYQIILSDFLVDEFINSILLNFSVMNEDLMVQSFVESGQPVPGFLFNSNYSLANLGYLWNVDFTKSDFRGKDALVDDLKNLKYLMIGIRSKGNFDKNQSILFNGKVVGKIIDVFSEGYGESQKLLLGMVDYEYAVSGVKFIDENNNELVSQSSPFSIPESW